MSMTNLPTLRIRRRTTFRLFWCYQCHRMVTSSPFDLSCPRCLGHFLQELDLPPPRLLLDLSTLSDPLPRRHHRLSLFEESTTTPPTRPRSDVFFIFNPPPPSPPSPPPPTTAVDPADYFTGPSLSELIEDLTQNDRPGPAPARESAIEAMPVVVITADHHARDGDAHARAHCPVCKDEFEEGGEARRMPCGHLYHSECIVTWLRLHNTCPICRLGLPANEDDDGGGGGAREEEEEGQGGARNRQRWNPFASFLSARVAQRSERRRVSDGDGDGVPAVRGVVVEELVASVAVSEMGVERFVDQREFGLLFIGRGVCDLCLIYMQRMLYSYGC
ncbi:E3 ubiquitin-protein ligase RING1 [Acorus calamus]|uniref:RING-type E3 ubiquitin transferase n=1 Tax=Acorus calamus TaxID=4465 RepID=A0AAV9CEY0_ACOCL|nr:E3 ubiquitin-protein ligase RING1 [Acorus calamus]